MILRSSVSSGARAETCLNNTCFVDSTRATKSCAQAGYVAHVFYRYVFMYFFRVNTFRSALGALGFSFETSLLVFF